MTDKEKRKAWQEKRKKEAKLAYAALMLVYPFFLEDLPGEKWKWITGYKKIYQISNFGRIKRYYKNGKTKIIKPWLTKKGYLRVNLFKNNQCKHYLIHQLVAEAFIPNPEKKPQVNHKFGNKFDNYFENLEWATQIENMNHATKTGLIKSGVESGTSKLTEEQVRDIREHCIPYDKKSGTIAFADKFNVSRNLISNVLHRRTYKNVE